MRHICHTASANIAPAPAQDAAVTKSSGVCGKRARATGVPTTAPIAAPKIKVAVLPVRNVKADAMATGCITNIGNAANTRKNKKLVMTKCGKVRRNPAMPQKTFSGGWLTVFPTMPSRENTSENPNAA